MDIKLFEVMKFLILNNWSLFFYAIKLLIKVLVSLFGSINNLQSHQKVSCKFIFNSFSDDIYTAMIQNFYFYCAEKEKTNFFVFISFRNLNFGKN